MHVSTLSSTTMGCWHLACCRNSSTRGSAGRSGCPVLPANRVHKLPTTLGGLRHVSQPYEPINCAAILLHSLVHITRRSLFARPRATKLHHHQNRHSHPPPDGQCSLANAKFNPPATPRNQSLQGSRPPSIAALEAPPEIRRDKTPAPPRKANARMF